MPAFSKLVPREEVEASAARLQKERLERARPPVLLIEEEEEAPAKNEFVKVALVVGPV